MWRWLHASGRSVRCGGHRRCLGRRDDRRTVALARRYADAAESGRGRCVAASTISTGNIRPARRQCGACRLKRTGYVMCAPQCGQTIASGSCSIRFSGVVYVRHKRRIQAAAPCGGVIELITSTGYGSRAVLCRLPRLGQAATPSAHRVANSVNEPVICRFSLHCPDNKGLRHPAKRPNPSEVNIFSLRGALQLRKEVRCRPLNRHRMD